LESAAGSLAVVVVDVGAKGVFEVASSEDEQPVEAVVTDGTDESLGVGVRARCSYRGLDSGYALGSEHLVERVGVLAVSVADQELLVVERSDDGEVAGLLGNPGAGRVGRHPGEVNSAGTQLDREEDVEAAEPDRLDGEGACKNRCGLLAQELLPTGPDPSWRCLNPAWSMIRRTVEGEIRIPSLRPPAIRG
jgi:hypothetical protein